MLTVLLFWLILAVVIGIIAGSRGRSGIGWFLLAVLISPLIAGILVLALPKPQSAFALRQQGRRPCPFCAEPIRLQAKLCPHCRSELVPPEQPKVPTLRSDLQYAQASPGKAVLFILIVIGIFLAPALLMTRPENKTTSKPQTTVVAKEARRSVAPVTETAALPTKKPAVKKPEARGEKVKVAENVYNHSMLLKKTPAEQAYFLGKAVKSPSDKCNGAMAFFMGLGDDGEAYWSVRCTNGEEFQVQIQADANGTTAILDCGVLKLVSGVQCFRKLSDQ